MAEVSVVRTISAEASLVARVFDVLNADPAIRGAANAIIPTSGRRTYSGAFPYVEVGDTLGTDWSVKGAKGREVRISLTIHDAPEMLDRARDLAELCEGVMDDIARDAHGWRLASFVFMKSMIDRSAGNRWRIISDWRGRLLRVN